MLQVHAGGKPNNVPFGEIPFQGAPQSRDIGGSSRLSGCRRATVAIAAEFKLRRTALAHALNLEPQIAAWAERFAEFVQRHGLTNMRLTPTEEFVWDPGGKGPPERAP